MEKEISEIKISMAEMKKDIKYLRVREEEKVTKAQFKPVQLITYGLASGTLFWALGQVLETAKAIF